MHLRQVIWILYESKNKKSFTRMTSQFAQKRLTRKSKKIVTSPSTSHFFFNGNVHTLFGSLSLFHYLPWPRKPDHSKAVASCSLSIYFMRDFWKEVSLLYYVVSEKDYAFSIWFCVRCGSAARLMGVTITCITLFWLDSFCFNVVKYVSVVCFLV